MISDSKTYFQVKSCTSRNNRLLMEVLWDIPECNWQSTCVSGKVGNWCASLMYCTFGNLKESIWWWGFSNICTVIYKCRRTFTNMVLFDHLQPLQYKEAYCITSEVWTLKLRESPCVIQDHRKIWCKKTKLHIFKLLVQVSFSYFLLA